MHFSVVYTLVNVLLLYQMKDEDVMAALQLLSLVKELLRKRFHGMIISAKCETVAEKCSSS